MKVLSKMKKFFKELEEDYGYNKSLITLVIVNVFFMFRGLYQYSEPWIFYASYITGLPFEKWQNQSN